MFSRSSLRRVSVVLGTHKPTLPPAELSDEEAYRVYAAALNLRNLRLGVLFVFCMILVPWPMDQRVLGAIPGGVERFAHLRLLVSSGSVAVYLLLWIPALARRPFPVAFLVSCLGGGVAMYDFGRLGGMEQPWVYWVFLVVFFAAGPISSLRWRLLHTVAILASFAVGLALARDNVVGDPMLPAALRYLVVVTGTSVLLGHVLNNAIAQNFQLMRIQENASREIQNLNATLERRVAAQTRELRRLVAYLETAREDERARVSRELHDELGQELTALRYALSLARQRFEKDPASLRANLDLLDELLGRTTASVRHIVTDLRPRILEDLGLGAGLEWLVLRTEEQAQLRCSLRMSQRELQLDAESSICAFRILQEALTNVIRHAKASKVEIDVAQQDDALHLTIRDDGVGLPPPTANDEEPPRPGGMGLIGMRERAHALGGTFRTDSRPGQGTTIEVTLPRTPPRPEAPGEAA